MATRKNPIALTRVRFRGGFAARRDMLSVLAVPVVLDDTDEEHTRFMMTTGATWSQKAIDADRVAVVHENSEGVKGWRVLGKRGDVHLVQGSGITVEQIADAGTGPGRLGHLASLRRIGGRLYACGDRHQVYEHTDAGWVRRDHGLRLDEQAFARGLNDIAGDGRGELCAVGSKGEIAVDRGAGWVLLDSPTTEHLYAVCRDAEGRYCAAGANGTVVRGDASGFERLCTDEAAGKLWDIVLHDGQLVASASNGLFTVRDGALVPFDQPPAPAHIGYRLAQADGVLWSLGSHQIWRLADGAWREWVCPENAP